MNKSLLSEVKLYERKKLQMVILTVLINISEDFTNFLWFNFQLRCCFLYLHYCIGFPKIHKINCSNVDTFLDMIIIYIVGWH